MNHQQLLELPSVIDVMTAATVLGIGRTAAYELVRTNRWPTPVIRVGGRIRTPAAPLLALVGVSSTETVADLAGQRSDIGTSSTHLTRGAPMRGHVYRRGSTWSYRVELGRDRNGARRQRSKGGFARRRDAEAALAAVLTSEERGEVPEPTRLTVGQYLIAEWLPALHDPRPNTLLSYSTLVRLHITPHIGDIPLSRLSTGDCDQLLGTLVRTDSARGRPLSPTTVRRVHAVLHAALNAAVDRGLVARNVSDRVRLPKANRSRPAAWTAQELQQLFSLAAGDPLAPLYLLMATTGLRRGEAVGLPWDRSISRKAPCRSTRRCCRSAIAPLWAHRRAATGNEWSPSS